MAQQPTHEVAEEKRTNYRKRDSDQLEYDVREILESHDSVEVWSDRERKLAETDDRISVWALEDGNRGVMVGGEHVRPEDVVELVGYEEVAEDSSDDEDDVEPDGGFDLTDDEREHFDETLLTDGGENIEGERVTVTSGTLEGRTGTVVEHADGDVDVLLETGGMLKTVRRHVELDQPVATDGGEDELESDDRVLVHMRNPDTKRTGTVTNVQRAGENLPLYIVDLDTAGSAHVTPDVLAPLESLELDSVPRGKVEALVEDFERWSDDAEKRPTLPRNDEHIRQREKARLYKKVAREIHDRLLGGADDVEGGVGQ